MKTDINIQKDLGKRIKERRKKLGLTQAQLCGEYMTRNMLSRIETGDATPSLDTLLFISKKLKMPPAYFLCRDSKEEAEYAKIVRIKDARRALGTEQYKKCIDICGELPSDDDEVSFIVVNARIMTAIDCFDRGELSDAAVHLDCAATALHSTVYMYSEMLSQIKLIRTLMTSLSDGVLPTAESLPRLAPVFFRKERYLYICALASTDKVTLADMMAPDSLYRKHLTARDMLNCNNYSESISLLTEILDGDPDAFCQYFALCDLEDAYRLSDDYKMAYEYAHKRMELHERYSVNTNM